VLLMALFTSSQEGARRASRKLGTAEVGGRLTRLVFVAKLPASGLATGDQIALVRLPAGVAITGGQFCWDVGHGAATTAIGTADDPGKYLAPMTTPSSAAVHFAQTQAEHFATVLTEEEILLMTNAVAAWAAGATVTGYIDVVGS
jgi:hypothetical protein